jgi:steroid 5-alpha reductase family enzyme
MAFFQIYLQGLVLIVLFFTLIWVLSVILKNASIVDIFWGMGYVLVAGFYFFITPDFSTRKIITMGLVALWGLRLSIYILWRNFGKPEDYRYKEFRKKYGEKRYWWFSYFQVFLLQGVLVWLISSPLLAINYFASENAFGVLDVFGILVWLIGFTFEAGGDWQLARFKMIPENKGRLLTTGFWKYTRHPNYFGDAAVWWGFAILSIAAGSYIPVLSALLMTWLIVKVSGVSMLERTLKNTKPGFEEYIFRTSAFIPWFPKAINK